MESGEDSVRGAKDRWYLRELDWSLEASRTLNSRFEPEAVSETNGTTLTLESDVLRLVIPAKAEIHYPSPAMRSVTLVDSRFRGNDEPRANRS